MWTEQLKLHTTIPSQVRRLEIKEKRGKKKRNDKIRKIKEEKRNDKTWKEKHIEQEDDRNDYIGKIRKMMKMKDKGRKMIKKVNYMTKGKCNNHTSELVEDRGDKRLQSFFFYWKLWFDHLTNMTISVLILFLHVRIGKALFIAPRGRTFEEFRAESLTHGWPSFRDEEVRTLY